jgi:hypothetical protein
VLARLFKLPALVLDFIEQPHILDGDHRLVGERFNQLNLLWREWSRRGAPQNQGTYGSAFAYQGNAKQGTISTNFLAFTVIIFRIG